MHTPSVLTVLLWKDYQQARTVILSVLFGLFGIQSVIFLISLAIGDTTSVRSLNDSLIALAMVAPFLIALGCAGMLIGQERQTNTWDFSSSLPGTWAMALFSKLTLTILASAVTTAVLLTIPLSCFLLGSFPLSSALSEVLSPLSSVVVFVEVLFAFFLACLLFKETLNGMFVAALFLISVHFVSIGLVFSYLETTNAWGLREPALIGIFSVLALLFLAASAIAFRWRWGSGRYWSWTGFGIASGKLASASARQHSATRRRLGNPPSARKSLRQLAIKSDFMLRTSALSIGVVGAVLPAQGVGIMLLVACAGLLGLTTFSGDQPKQRFRFLADRGVSPVRLTVSRVYVSVVGLAVLLAATIFGAVLWSKTARTIEFLPTVVLVVVTFSVAMISGLCFRQVVVAATVSALFVVLACLLSIFGHDLLFDVAIRASLRSRVWLLFSVYGLVGLTIQFASLLPLVRRWIIEDRPNLKRAGLSLIAFACCGPILLTVCTAWSVLPEPTRPLGSFDQIRAQYAATPKVRTNTPLITSNYGGLVTSFGYPNTPGYEMQLEEELTIVGSDIDQRSGGNIESGLENLSQAVSELEKLMEAPVFSNTYSSADLFALSRHSAELTLIGLWSVRNGHEDLASRCMKLAKRLNEQLLSHPMSPAFESQVRSQLSLWVNLRPEQLNALGSRDQVLAMLPKLPSKDDYQRHESLHKSEQVYVIRGKVARLPKEAYSLQPFAAKFPPLQWFYERAIRDEAGYLNSHFFSANDRFTNFIEAKIRQIGDEQQPSDEPREEHKDRPSS